MDIFGGCSVYTISLPHFISYLFLHQETTSKFSGFNPQAFCVLRSLQLGLVSAWHFMCWRYQWNKASVAHNRKPRLNSSLYLRAVSSTYLIFSLSFLLLPGVVFLGCFHLLSLYQHVHYLAKCFLPLLKQTPLLPHLMAHTQALLLNQKSIFMVRFVFLWPFVSSQFEKNSSSI